MRQHAAAKVQRGRAGLSPKSSAKHRLMTRRQLLSGVAAALAADFALASTDRVTEASLRWQIPAHINGRGPFRLFVDTGAERSAISAFLAASLGHRVADLPMIRRDGVVGSQLTPHVLLKSLRCGPVERTSIAALVLPDAVLGNWDGLLGADMLADNALSIAAPRWEAAIESSASSGRRGTRSLRFAAGTVHLPSFRLSIGGRAVTALLDSGAVHSVGNRALAQALELATFDTAVVMDAAGARLAASLAMAPEFRLDGAVLPAATLRIVDLPMFSRRGLTERPALLLGLDRLNTLAALQIDFRSRHLHAR
jgi:predicted aspartyl protease